MCPGLHEARGTTRALVETAGASSHSWAWTHPVIPARRAERCIDAPVLRDATRIAATRIRFLNAGIRGYWSVGPVT